MLLECLHFGTTFFAILPLRAQRNYNLFTASKMPLPSSLQNVIHIGLSSIHSPCLCSRGRTFLPSQSINPSDLPRSSAEARQSNLAIETISSFDEVSDQKILQLPESEATRSQTRSKNNQVEASWMPAESERSSAEFVSRMIWATLTSDRKEPEINKS